VKGSIFSSRFTADEIMFLCKNLSSLISLGVSMEEALSDILKKSSGKMEIFLNQISKEISRGVSFSKALENSPGSFSTVFVSMIKAGENSGQLPSQLDKIYQDVEREDQIQKELKHMLISPKISIMLSFVLAFLNFGFIIPMISEGLGMGNIQLEGQGLFLENIFEISNVLSSNVIITTFFLLGILVLISIIFSSAFFRLALLEIFAILPSFSRWIKNNQNERFFRVIFIFIRAGIPIVTALKEGGKLSESRDLKDIGEVLGHLLDKGDNLTDSFKALDYFDSSIIARIASAEKSGDFEGSFYDLAELFYKEGEEDLKIAMRKIKGIVKGFVFAFAFSQIFLIVMIALKSILNLF
jgi:type IV pilus assembly protein PilC